MRLGKHSSRWFVGAAAAALLCISSAQAAPQRAAARSVYEAGMARLHEGDRVGALALLEKAATRSADDVGLWQLVGDLRYALDQAPAAVEAWKSAAALRPADDGLAERVARGSVHLGDYTQAAEAEAQVVALIAEHAAASPDASRVDLGTGRRVPLAASLRQHLGILSELAVLAGDFTTGEMAARRLMKLAPQSVDGPLALAYVQLHAAEYDEAAFLYEDILRVEPENTTALNNLGNIRYMRRDFDSAAELFERILEVDHASPYSESIALANLGELMQLQRAFKDAESMYRQAIDLQPKGAWGYMGMAALLDITGRYDQAIDHMIDGWERDQNQLARLNMHFYEAEWIWQRDALIAEIEGDLALAEKLWHQIASGDVDLLKRAAAWHLHALRTGASP